MKKLLVIAALSVAAAHSASAEGMAIGAKLGTLGPGVELTGYLTENLNVRVGGNYLKTTVTVLTDDFDYDVDLNFRSMMATLDWHPFENGFRISAGALLNDNQLDMTATPKGIQDVGDAKYTAAQIGTVRGVATFNRFAPYLGLGYGNAVADDVAFSFVFDLGLVFQGAGTVDLSADGLLASDPTFQQNLAKEESDAQDAADKFSVYPVLAIGFAYYFW